MIVSRGHIRAYVKFAQRKKNDRLRRQSNSAGRGCSCEEKCSFTNRRDRASLCFARAIQTRTRSTRAPRGWCHLTCRAVTEPKTASARCYSTPRAHPLNILSKLLSSRWYPLGTFVRRYFRKYYESTFESTTLVQRCTCSPTALHVRVLYESTKVSYFRTFESTKVLSYFRKYNYSTLYSNTVHCIISCCGCYYKQLKLYSTTYILYV